MTSIDFKQLLKEQRAERQRQRQALSSTDADDDDTTSSSKKADVDCSIPVPISSAGSSLRQMEKDMGGAAVAEVSATAMFRPLVHRADAARFPLGSIPTLHYLPDAIRADDATAIIHFIETGAIEGGQSVWQMLRTRRLQCWGGQPPDALNAKVTLEPLPTWLDHLIDSLISVGIFDSEKHDHTLGIPCCPRPNHVLINEYQPHQGIIHHTDGPRYFPQVAIISLGSPCVFSFRTKLASHQIGEHDAGDVVQLVLQPNSILLFSGELYSSHLHGLECDSIEATVGENCINCAQAGVQVGDVVSAYYDFNYCNINGLDSVKIARDIQIQIVVTYSVTNDIVSCCEPFQVERNGTRTSLTIRHLIDR
jgi:alkylated DNA repair protein alkB homolog 6